jgi:hypothetical protein
MRDAAGVQNGYVDPWRRVLDVAVGNEAFSDLVRVRMRHLAAEEIDRERRHDGAMLTEDLTKHQLSRSDALNRRPAHPCDERRSAKPSATPA